MLTELITYRKEYTMKKIIALIFLASTALPAYSALNTGTIAPNFVTQASLGGKVFSYSLADALKKGPVVLILTVVIYGFSRNGGKFLKIFVPSGIPWFIIWLVVPIEVISFLSRPVSHSLRLWGNMLAGHIVLKVFGGMVVGLASIGALGAITAILPLGMAVALTGLEFLVGALQAFVFAVLTCVYLHDALHPGH